MWILNPESGELEQQEEQLQAVPQQDIGEEQFGGLEAPQTGGAAPMGATGGPQGPATPAPTSSGNFTDIGKYLAQNEGGAQELGETVAGGVQETTDTANTALDQGQQEFNDALEAANPGMTSEEINAISSDPAALADFVSDPSNVERFIDSASGSYDGPTGYGDLETYEDLIDSVTDANQAQEATTTVGGRQELIRDVYQKPSRAKAGMLGLDEALVTQTEGAIEPINEAAAEAGNVQNRLDEMNATATEAVAGARDTRTERAGEIENAFMGEEGMYNRLQDDIRGRTEQTQAQAEADRDEALNYADTNWLTDTGVLYMADEPAWANGYQPQPRLTVNMDKANQVTDGALNQLGISREQYMEMLDLYVNPEINQTAIDPAWRTAGSFQDYTQPLATDINMGNVATAEEYAQLDALAQLFGDRVSPFIGTPDQAGTAGGDYVDFDYDALMAILNDPKYLTAKVTSSLQ